MGFEISYDDEKYWVGYSLAARSLYNDKDLFEFDKVIFAKKDAIIVK